MSLLPTNFVYMDPLGTVRHELLIMFTLASGLSVFGRTNAVLCADMHRVSLAAQSVVQDNATAPSGNRQLLAAVLFALSVAILLPVLPPGGAGGSDNLFL